jgi:hypothetical protein
MPGGKKLRQWMKISAYSGRYHYALSFNPYGILHR